MRALKFRRYSKTLKEFTMINNMSDLRYQTWSLRDGPEMDISKMKFEQFIGLKDVNDNPIYEGDIVKWGHIDGFIERLPRIAIVSLEPSLNFKTVNLGDNNHSFHYGSFAYARVIPKAMEIIGNIHQHSDLLKDWL